MHVAVGRVEVLLHVVAVVPARRGPQPCARPPEPARVARKTPCEGVVLDKGRGLHGGVEGQVELVVGVGTVCPAWDPPPRPPAANNAQSSSMLERIRRRTASSGGLYSNPGSSTGLNSRGRSRRITGIDGCCDVSVEGSDIVTCRDS